MFLIITKTFDRCNLPQNIGKTLGMSPNIDDERGPIPMVLGEGIVTYEQNQNFNLGKRCHDNNENIKVYRYLCKCTSFNGPKLTLESTIKSRSSNIWVNCNSNEFIIYLDKLTKHDLTIMRKK